MYNVPEFVPKIYLIHISGDCWEYKNLKHAADELWRLRLYSGYSCYIGEQFSKAWTWTETDGWKSYYTFEYILRTELGDIITVGDLLKVRTKKPLKWRYFYKPAGHLEGKKNYRKDPVPGTGKPASGSYYRRPKATQEARLTRSHELDEDIQFYNVKIRARRNLKNLPNAWDDVPRWWDRKEKNWKRYRKTQYKTKNK